MPPRSDAARFAHSHALREARNELRLAKYAMPAALAIALLVVGTDLGRSLAGILFGMWLHELGHATAAWLCGYPALPGPWVTMVGGRSRPFAFVLMVGLGYAVYRGWTEARRAMLGAALAGLVAQLFCSIVLVDHTARVFITFSGAAGSLVFGAALMATFFAPPGHKLHKDWLRWGFLAIGAASFVLSFTVWWRVHTKFDLDALGLGQLEGRGLSDPSQLLQWGWTVPLMTSRYVGLGVMCLLVLFTLQFFHVQRTREALERLESGWARRMRET